MTILTLGQDGIAYVESCLRQGTGLSAKALSLPLKDGEAFTSVPNDTSLDRARSFNTGGLMFRHKANTWLVKHAQTLWRAWPVGTLVIQDVWGRSSDPAA